MLGTTNARYNGEFEFNENSHVKYLNFKAGMNIAKGDLVEVIAEELPDELPIVSNDVNALFFSTLSMPKQLDNNFNMCQAFHLNTNAAQAGTAGNALYSSVWSSTLSTITRDTTIMSSSIVSTAVSLNWGEPQYVGNGYWVIPGDDGNVASVTKTNRVTGETETYTYPSQVLLVHIDQASGVATSVDTIFDSATGTWAGAWQYGRPLIFQLSDDAFIFVHKAFHNGIYQIFARPFKINFNEDISATYMEWTTEDPLSMATKNAAFRFFGMCGHFVNKEKREVYFLLEEETKMGHLKLEEADNSLTYYTALRFEVDLTPIRDINYLVKTTLGVPLVTPYHNNLASYNVITTKDNKHCLTVFNNYYWDFEIDYDANTVQARVFPLRYKPSFTIRATKLGNENATTNALPANYTLRDWDLVTHNLKAFRNQNLSADGGQIPWLYRVSDTKYLMAFLTTATAVQGLVPESSAAVAQVTAITAAYGAPLYAMLDFNEELHTLKKDERFAFSGCLGNAVANPVPAVSKNIVYVDPNNYIHQICPGYSTTFLYPTCRSKSRLSFNQMNDLVYKYGTKPISKREDLRLLYVGIANNTAEFGENVEIIAMPEQVSLLYQSIEEEENNT